MTRTRKRGFFKSLLKGLARKLLIVDLFCGGGGVSYAIEQALGQPVTVAVNHDPAAIEMHETNHPRTEHHLEDVFDVDPWVTSLGQRVDLLWASPDCTHFSRARGGKPVSKKIRSLADVVVKWAKSPAKPWVICIENVAEFLTWGPVDDDGKVIKARRGEYFRRWVKALEAAGYVVEWRVLVACDFGDPTSRKRLFIVARCDGHPIVWPEPTHGPEQALPYRTAAECIDFDRPCPSIFERKRPLAKATQRRVVEGMLRYTLTAADPFVVPVKSWGGGGNGPRSIHEPTRTVTTSKGGEYAVVGPSLVNLTHGGRLEDIGAPLKTVTAAHRGEKALVAPGLVQTGYGERKGQAPRVLDLHQPLGTVVAAGAKHAVANVFVAKHYGGPNGKGTPGQDVREPLSTITSSGQMGPVAVHLDKMYGSARAGAPVNEPLHTITASGGRGGGHLAQVGAKLGRLPFLTKYYGQGGQWSSVSTPMHTTTAKARMGLVEVYVSPLVEARAQRVAAWLLRHLEGRPEALDPSSDIYRIVQQARRGFVTVVVGGEHFVVVDVGLRMLQPRELARAHSFPEDYTLTGNKGQQIARIGRSVPVRVAEAVVRAQFGLPSRWELNDEQEAAAK